jgi:hypothetical protein
LDVSLEAVDRIPFGRVRQHILECNKSIMFLVLW